MVGTGDHDNWREKSGKRGGDHDMREKETMLGTGDHDNWRENSGKRGGDHK